MEFSACFKYARPSYNLPFAGHPTHGTAEIKYKFCSSFLEKGALVTMKQILLMTGQFCVLQAGDIINMKELLTDS